MQRWNHGQEQASMKNKTSCWTRLWLDVSNISVNLCWIWLYWFCCLNSNRCQKFKHNILEKNSELSRISHPNKSLRSWVFIWTRERSLLLPECGSTRVEWTKNSCSDTRDQACRENPSQQVVLYREEWTQTRGDSTKGGSILSLCYTGSEHDSPVIEGERQTFLFETYTLFILKSLVYPKKSHKVVTLWFTEATASCLWNHKTEGSSPHTPCQPPLISLT